MEESGKRVKQLDVEKDNDIDSGSMNNARYFARGYWVPNWAIEWLQNHLVHYSKFACMQ